jgi:hypothetical protein
MPTKPTLCNRISTFSSWQGQLFLPGMVTSILGLFSYHEGFLFLGKSYWLQFNKISALFPGGCILWTRTSIPQHLELGHGKPMFTVMRVMLSGASSSISYIISHRIYLLCYCIYWKIWPYIYFDLLQKPFQFYPTKGGRFSLYLIYRCGI